MDDHPITTKLLSECKEINPYVNERTLITFALFVFNHEKFIREAVEGAFAQTYSTLEIILSDDGSSDRTYEIMQEMVAAYRGPHTIILNKNEKNLGISRHVYNIFSMARGELIVAAAGDDISAPDRVQSLFEVWRRFGYPGAVASSLTEIDENGNTIFLDRYKQADYKEDFYYFGRDNILKYLKQRYPIPFIGAVLAYKRSLIASFPKIDEYLPLEDHVYFFRAMLIDGVAVSKKKLVKYRRSSSSFSNPVELASKANNKSKEQKLNDIRKELENKKDYTNLLIRQQISDYNFLNNDLRIKEKHFYGGKISFKKRLWNALKFYMPSFLFIRFVFWYRYAKYHLYSLRSK